MSFTEDLLPLLPSIGLFFGLGTVLLPILYYSCLFTYNVYFHPLSKYPGPLGAAGSDWWLLLSFAQGTGPADYKKLHSQYGPVVRTAPNELSYINASQWKEIYGYRLAGEPEFAKDYKYHSGMDGPPNILNADQQYHRYIRKMFAHGFSDKALRDQEVVIQEYVGMLMEKFHECGQGGTVPLDVVSWYSFMTFDFIGYLTFGQSFDCMRSHKYHSWFHIFFTMAKALGYGQAITRLPYLLQAPARQWALPDEFNIKYDMIRQATTEKTQHRLKKAAAVTGFMDKLIDAHNAGEISFDQLVSESEVLLVAGSETTATLMSGLTCLLMRHPKVFKRLAEEIRGNFQSPEKITLVSVNQCKYLFACIEEAIRVYPPSPQPHHRVIPPGGAVVNGEFLPEGVIVSIPIAAISNSPMNFVRADEFIPERWLDEDPQFQDDVREAFQPFSHGPRNCIGRNLAYVETKIVMARLVWHFNLENATEGDWFDQKVYGLWIKPPLWVKLHPVQRG